MARPKKQEVKQEIFIVDMDVIPKSVEALRDGVWSSLGKHNKGEVISVDEIEKDLLLKTGFWKEN